MDDRPIEEQVFDLIQPAIDKLLSSMAKRQHMHIVVMDPQKKPWEGTFEDAILAEFQIGNSTEWQHDYRMIARAKAAIAWREQCSNIVPRLIGPAVLRPGDTIHYGSFVYEGMVVAASGVEPYFDMLVAGWFALAYQQVCQHYITKHLAGYPNEDFLPDSAIDLGESEVDP